MQGKYILRRADETVKQYLNEFPVVAILGPRQSGKSTLAKQFDTGDTEKVYLDLELSSDIRKLSDAEYFFESYPEAFFCLDEIQRVPDMFKTIRSVVDRTDRNGQFLILGSASPDLIRQSSETLAGRIAYIELTPFQLHEISQSDKNEKESLEKYWIKGGFPRSFLSASFESSYRWREQFVRTFLERDIPQLGFQIPAETLGRLWRMCAHQHGQLLNASALGSSLGYSHTSIRRHIDLLTQTFMIRLLSPVEVNLKKRLVKQPKLYIRDTGILHTLLEIQSKDQLLGHPSFGSSWEGLCIENILGSFPNWRAGFYRTSAGAEIDLVLEKGQNRFAFEFKASKNPQVSRGFWNSIEDLNPDHTWIVAPVDDTYPLKKNVTVTPLGQVFSEIFSKID